MKKRAHKSARCAEGCRKEKCSCTADEKMPVKTKGVSPGFVRRGKSKIRKRAPRRAGSPKYKNTEPPRSVAVGAGSVAEVCEAGEATTATLGKAATRPRETAAQKKTKKNL